MYLFKNSRLPLFCSPPPIEKINRGEEINKEKKKSRGFQEQIW